MSSGEGTTSQLDEGMSFCMSFPDSSIPEGVDITDDGGSSDGGGIPDGGVTEVDGSPDC